MRKKMWKKFLPITMAVVVFATSMPVDVLANTVSQNAVIQTEQVEETSQENTVVVEADATTTSDIFDGTTITLDSLVLKATYKEKDSNTTTVVELTQDGDFELPYNADINMRLNYVLGDGGAIESGKTYIYQLPTTIRVDVEADHELEDGSGKSIGKVHISKDGTLSFQFYEEAVAGNKNVNFFVQFEGGLSEDLQEAGKEADISFPTASGDFDFKVTTTDSTEEIVETEPRDIVIQKSGSQLVDEVTGRKMIEWTVELGPEGRASLDGTLVDNIPAGLEFVDSKGVKLVEAYEGTVSHTLNGDRLEITFDGVKTHYRAKVKFYTYYDGTALGTDISNGTYDDVSNEAIFNPDDGTTSVTDSGTVRITPDMISKVGSEIKNDYIEWTVVLNREQLDLQNSTYTDVIGEGMTLDGNVTIEPAGPTAVTTPDGFTVSFPNGTEDKKTYTIKYKTQVTDYAVQSYKNTATLTGTNAAHSYNVSKEAVVPGLNLLDKNCATYNTVTNTFTWTIAVNTSALNLRNVVVTDTFDATKMKFISASMTPAASSDAINGSLVFEFGDLSEQKNITIVTKVKNPETYKETDWIGFSNNAKLESSDISTEVTDTAERTVQVKKPDLISKSGQIKNGVIEWTVTFNEPQLTVKDINFSDVLPEGTSYVEGTFRIQNMWYDANPLYREPNVQTVTNGMGNETEKITYSLDDTNEAEKAFFAKAFQIIYQTKVTDADTATTNNQYTNEANTTITFEDDMIVEDGAQSTVQGVVGGVVDKTYSYKSGSREVDWTVTINGSRNDMSAVQYPKITDQLADYFDYVDGALYLVAEDGTETEVFAGDYVVSVVNGKLIVQLPRDAQGYYPGDNCYKFKFTTRFNVLAAELEGKTITNTVDFQGSGKTYTKESANISNVSFSSSSAGAVVKRELRVKQSRCG